MGTTIPNIMIQFTRLKHSAQFKDQIPAVRIENLIYPSYHYYACTLDACEKRINTNTLGVVSFCFTARQSGLGV